MYGYSLYGSLYEIIPLNYPWCYIRSYLLHVGTCLLYHSFFLLTCFRFFRIVLYKYKQLQTFQFIFQLTLIHWLIDFLLLIPLLTQHWIEYISECYFCEILFSNFQGTLYAGVIAYSFPMFSIVLMYTSIIHYMNKTKSQSILQNRQQTNRRDFVVLRRIIILIGILTTLSFPTIIIWLSFVVTNYIDPIYYKIGWLLFALSFSVLPITFALLTSQLRELLKILYYRQKCRIQPIQTMTTH
ncbi:hypothetical protein I4U23_022112 [Adineta vaga]|nr:hypothetical protein I4U23_022112 [Adineta vaga]